MNTSKKTTDNPATLAGATEILAGEKGGSDVRRS